MRKELEFKVTGRQDGLPVKKILALELGLSRREISRLKFTGGIKVNGEQVRITESVHDGDTIQVVFAEQDSAHAARLSQSVDILYEDEDLVIVNKPAGMPCHPSHMHLDDDMGTLLAAPYGGRFTVRAVGRLDLPVSGVMLYAKSQPAAARLSRQKDTGEMQKRYLAAVSGIMEQSEGVLQYTLKKKEGQRARIVGKGGQQCITHYRVVEQGKDWSLLEVTLETGRSHQIRAGLAYFGHPLFGDTLYGEDRSIYHTALHCASLDLMQPFSGKKIHAEAELPEEFLKLLEQLRKESGYAV